MKLLLKDSATIFIRFLLVVTQVCNSLTKFLSIVTLTPFYPQANPVCFTL